MDPIEDAASSAGYVTPGLCASCAHARAVPHPRGGGAYWRCGMHDRDASFPKYPRLPVIECLGYAPKG